MSVVNRCYALRSGEATAVRRTISVAPRAAGAVVVIGGADTELGLAPVDEVNKYKPVTYSFNASLSDLTIETVVTIGTVVIMATVVDLVTIEMIVLYVLSLLQQFLVTECCRNSDIPTIAKPNILAD